MDKESLVKRLMKGVFTAPPQEGPPGFEMDSGTGTLRKYREPQDAASELEIPSEINGITVKAIGDGAFSGCNSLIDVTIPEGVESIGPNAFSHCQNLTVISIPSSVCEIGDFAFDNCVKLDSIILPYCMKSINKAVFANCTNLRKLTVPPGVVSIGINATLRCFNLTIYAIEGSYGHSYATENRINFKALKVCYNVTGQMKDIHGNPIKDLSFKSADEEYTTGEDGEFCLKDVSGRVILKPESGSGFKFEPAEIEAYGPDAMLSFTAFYDVSGTVLDRAGKAMPGFSFRIMDKEVMTDDEGCFLMEGLSGKTTVEPYAGNMVDFSPSSLVAEGPWDQLVFEVSYRVSGMVVDAAGNGVPKVKVGTGHSIAATDEDGWFELDGLAGLEHVKPSSGDGYGFEPAETLVTGPTEELLFRATYSVSGTIKEESGKAVAGLRFELGDAQFQTDPVGGFTIQGLSGITVIKPVNREGYSFAPEQVEVRGPWDEASFRTLYDVSGLIVDESGAGVPGVVLSCGKKEHRSDENGAFLFSGLGGSSTIKLKGPKGYTFSPSEIKAAGPQSDILIETWYAVEGMVLDPLGNGIEGVELSAGKASAVTDATGAFLLNGLSGATKLTVSKAGYEFAETLTLNGPDPGMMLVAEPLKSEEAAVEKEKAMSAPLEIAVEAPSEGESEEGAESSTAVPGDSEEREATGVQEKETTQISEARSVPASDAITTIPEVIVMTDPEGNFLIPDISGTVVIKFAGDEGYSFNPSELTISGPEDEIYVEVTYEISGMVADEEGHGVGGAEVKAGDKNTLTGPDGRFSISGLGGSVSVAAYKEGYVIKSGPVEVVKPLKDIEIIAFGRVAGRILDKLGNAIAGVKVELASKFTTSAEDGSYEMIWPGSASRIAASMPGYDFEPASLDLAVPSRGLDFTGSYRVSGKVMDSSGRGVAGVNVSAGEVTATTAEDGSYMINGLSGTVSITPLKDRYVFSPCHAETAGPLSGADFKAGYVIKGRVAYPTGKGIGGVEVKIGNKQQ